MTGESEPVSDTATLDMHLCGTHTLCIWIVGYNNHPVELGSLRIWANVSAGALFIMLSKAGTHMTCEVGLV